jgi:hypothetical protein
MKNIPQAGVAVSLASPSNPALIFRGTIVRVSRDGDSALVRLPGRLPLNYCRLPGSDIFAQCLFPEDAAADSLRFSAEA